MTVNVHKDEQNVLSDLNRIATPHGMKGHQVRQAETMEDAWRTLQLGRRNFVANGAMQVWQRGTTFNNLSAGGATNYTADRWNATRYSSGDLDVSRQTVDHYDVTAPNSAGVFEYALRIGRGTGDAVSSQSFLVQPLESVDSKKLRGQYVCLSFYARRGTGYESNSDFDLGPRIFYHTDTSNNDDGVYYTSFKNASGNTASATEGVQLGLNFKRYYISGYLPHNIEQVAVSFALAGRTTGAAVANDHVEITGVQLEVGREPTPYEHRNYSEELAHCQRYCNVIAPNVAYGHYGFVGWCESSTRSKVQYTFPVVMRATPSLTRSGGFYYDGASTNPSFSSQYGVALTPFNCRIEDTISNGTTGQGIFLINNNDANATITFDAEL